jgi:hypothetical protein
LRTEQTDSTAWAAPGTAGISRQIAISKAAFRKFRGRTFFVYQRLSRSEKPIFSRSGAAPPAESLRPRSWLQEKGLYRLILAALPALFQFPWAPNRANTIGRYE